MTHRMNTAQINKFSERWVMDHLIPAMILHHHSYLLYDPRLAPRQVILE
jgi:hypothetical protein